MRNSDKRSDSIKSPSSQRDLSSKSKTPSSGRSFADDPQLASEAGRKGGKAAHRSTNR